MKSTVILTLLLGTFIVACSTTDSGRTEPNPNLAVTIEASPLQTKLPSLIATRDINETKDPLSTTLFTTPTSAPVPTINPTQLPDVAPTREVTEFFKPKDYSEFDSNLQALFQSAVDNEFVALEEKSGLSIAVYTEGKTWTYAMGEADSNVEMMVNTPLMVSSSSKTFLSALILSQIEMGFYKLTDSLETLLENHPDFALFELDKVNLEVTIEQLLTMSSGMADFSHNMAGKSGSYKEPTWSPFDTVNLIQSAYSPPGKFQYNDTNVVLLAIVAEFFAEEPLADLYRKEFLTPLNMTAVILPEEGIAWHPNLFNDRAEGFTSPRIAMPYTDVSSWGGTGFGNMIQTAPFELGYYLGAVGRLRYACCGFISTPENVARWAYELYRPTGLAVSESVRSQLLNSFSPERVPAWGVTGESYGYFVSKRTFKLSDSRIITAYGHPGGGGGFSSVMLYSPELDLSVSILANSEMSFRGVCGPEKSMNCIASEIFSAYSLTENH